MCQRCDNPKSKHLHHWEEVKDHDRFNKETDMMPDGIHAKLYKFWQYNVANKNEGWRVNRAGTLREDLKKRQQDLWDEYWKLPEPRPSYLEWACARTERDRFDLLDDRIMRARTDSILFKAIDLLLKHGKSLPKQTIELSGKEDKVDLDQLFKKLCALKNIPTEIFEKYIGKLESN